jgi:hypothetical protein
MLVRFCENKKPFALGNENVCNSLNEVLMGFLNFLEHTGMGMGAIVGAADGDGAWNGFKKGLQGTIDAAEASAGIMTGDPMLVAQGAEGFIKDSTDESAPSGEELMSKAAESTFDVAA